MAEIAEESLAPPAAPEADAAESPQAQEPAGSVEQGESDEEYDEGACDRRQGPPQRRRRRPPADRVQVERAEPLRGCSPASLPSTQTIVPRSIKNAGSSAEEQSGEEEEEEESSGDEDEKQPLSQRSAYASKHPLPQPTAPKRTRTNRFPKIPK